eukprot:c22340_g1_i2 orf=88-714(+)
MMGSLITRALIMAVGYVYPAYKCFKCVEMNRPDVEQLRFWCQYWIIIAVVTVLERLGDTFVSWLPLYSEAKLAFIIFLWSPRTLVISEAHPRPPPPPPPPGYQELPSDYHQPPPVTDYTPSAPVLPTEYLSQQGGSTVGVSHGYQPQAHQQGYPQQMPGYPQPPYIRAEQEAPSQMMGTQPLPHPTAPLPPDLMSSYMTRRQRSRRQP